MKYNVSEEVKDALAKLTGDAKVQDALRFIEADQEDIIQKQIELTGGRLDLLPGHHR